MSLSQQKLLAELTSRSKQIHSAKTLEKKLSLAYGLYKTISDIRDQPYPELLLLQNTAKSFMKDLLSVESDEEMIRLGEQQQTMEQLNPHFIAGKGPLPKTIVEKLEKLTPEQKKALYKWKHLTSLLTTLQQHLIMTVNEPSREKDEKSTNYLTTPDERADLRVILKNGLFYHPVQEDIDIKKQFSKRFFLCDTARMTSHDKDGYAAYVINTQGEISIFDHFNVTDGTAHSSPNAGGPSLLPEK
jgi:hypothetical protein